MIIAHKAVHWPLIPAKRYEDLYPNFKFDSKITTEEDVNGKPLLTKEVNRKPYMPMKMYCQKHQNQDVVVGRERSSVVGDEYRCLTSVDEGVGKIFKVLENQNKLENTIIIYVVIMEC